MRPVRISGPLVSRAMARGRPPGLAGRRGRKSSARVGARGQEREREEDAPATAPRALSMTDWWYSYDPCEKFIRTAEQDGQGGQFLRALAKRPRSRQGLKSRIAKRRKGHVPTFIPASRSSWSFSTELVLGPMVAMMEVCTEESDGQHRCENDKVSLGGEVKRDGSAPFEGTCPHRGQG